MTIRMAMMPRMPPVRITHVLFDIATATRIESMANTMSVSSTLTTVAQNAVSPSMALRRRRRAPIVSFFAAEEMRVRQIQQVRGAEQLDPAQLDQIHRQQRRDGAKEEGAENPVAERLLLLLLREAQDQHRQNQGVVGA